MRIRLQASGHAASLLTELNCCRQSRQFCDVFLQVGNRTFPAHRGVLACAGSYFRNLFGRTAALSNFTLEFISPANFEKVLTFVYTGEILTDLIDVGVFYELAERLGVSELVRACHDIFPDMQSCKPSSAHRLDSSLAAATSSGAVVTAASVSAVSLCSSDASCSSLSSSACLSAAATPAVSSSPLLPATKARPGQEADSGLLTLNLKVEDVQPHMTCGHVTPDHQLPAENLLPCESSSALPSGLSLQLKTEQGLEDQSAGVSCGDGNSDEQLVSGGFSVPQSSDPTSSVSSPLPDSSAQHVAETCTPTSSSREPLSGQQPGAVDDMMVDLQKDRGLMFREVGDRENEGREALQGNGQVEGAEEEQWRHLADEIIELSDDENFMEGEEEDDDDDLVCVENGSEGSSANQVTSVVVNRGGIFALWFN